MEFKENLKNELKYQNMTQTQLAKKLGYKTYRVNDWIRGKCQPSIEDIIKICKILDITSDYLIGLSDF